MNMDTKFKIQLKYSISNALELIPQKYKYQRGGEEVKFNLNFN